MGEVGLAGEVRQVPGAARRLAEAVRLGFTRAIVPMATPAVEGAAMARVGSLAEALHAAFVNAGENTHSGGPAPAPPVPRRPVRLVEVS
jgi:hypothetical protein